MKPTFKIKSSQYHEIVKTIGSHLPERGGILMGKDGVITDFIFDKDAKTSSTTYTLNTDFLNPIIKKLKEEGKSLMGVLHSHPIGYAILSEPDRKYFSELFENFPEHEYIFTPIVFSAKEDKFELFPYIFYKNGTVDTAELEIVSDNYEADTTEKDVATIPTQSEGSSDHPVASEKSSVQETKKKEDVPDFRKIETDRRVQVMITIGGESHNPSDKRGDFVFTKTNIVVSVVSAVYFFTLGINAVVLPIAVLYILKNSAAFGRLMNHFGF